ncbi:MAG: phospholipid carrier-dependent glycosyltransferase [Planctomycetota bacterium]
MKPQDPPSRPHLSRAVGLRLFATVFLIYLLFTGSTFEGYGEDTFRTSAGFAKALVGGGAPEHLSPQGFYLEPILGVPFYAAGALLDRLTGRADVVAFRVFAWNAFVALQAALAVILLYVTAIKLFRSVRTALLVALLYAFATITFAYSGLGHETMLTLALLASVAAIVSLSREPLVRWVVLAGLAAGATAATKSYGALFVPFLFLYFLLALRQHRSSRAFIEQAALFCVCVLPFAIGDLFYARILARAAGHLPGGRLTLDASRIPFALVGMYWSAGKGFFLYNLPLLLAIPLAGAFWKSFRIEAVSFLCLILFWSLLVAAFAPPLAWGDEMWGPRYLYPLVPLFTLVLGAMVREDDSIPLVYSIPAAVSAAAGMAIQLLGRVFPKNYVTNVFGDASLNNVETWQYMPAFSPLRLRWYIAKAHLAGRTVEMSYAPVYLSHQTPAGAPAAGAAVAVLPVSPSAFPPAMWWYGYLGRMLAGERSSRVVAPVIAAAVIAGAAVVSGVMLAGAARGLSSGKAATEGKEPR